MTADVAATVERVLGEHQRRVDSGACWCDEWPTMPPQVQRQTWMAHVAARVAEALAAAAPEAADREALADLLGRTRRQSVHGSLIAQPEIGRAWLLSLAQTVLDEGFRRDPKGKTVTEWGVWHHGGHVGDAPTQGAANDACRVWQPSRRHVVTRQRTSYDDVVTEWVAVDE